MTLATRVIPTLLQRGATLVKGVGFDSWRSLGHVRQAVRIHNAREVDELIYLDIGATPEGRGPNFELVESFARDCMMPLTVGGGVKSVEDARRLLECGADKVAIGTSAFTSGLLHEVANKFGEQAVVLSVDVMRWGRGWSGRMKCGRTPWPQLDHVGVASLRYWLESGRFTGAGEILLTSIDRDGTLQGYDLDLIKAVSEVVSIPVIANGGAGTYEHMRQAIEAGAHAVAAGAMFQWTDQTPRGASQYLLEHGIPARVT